MVQPKIKPEVKVIAISNNFKAVFSVVRISFIIGIPPINPMRAGYTGYNSLPEVYEIQQIIEQCDLK